MIRVFLTDDMPAVREVLRTYFEQSAGRFELVGEAADGRQAMAGIAESQPDVVVLDLSMPAMSGLEVLEALQRGGYRLPVIICTGSGDLLDARLPGLVTPLRKPFALSALDAAIIKALISQAELAES